VKRIVVLVSGRGLNLQALIGACAGGQMPGRIVAVIADREGTGAVVRAQQAGLSTQVIPYRSYARREDFDAVLGEAVAAAQPDVVVLAGFMRILTPGFIGRFRGRLLNIHPSLLPKYPGLRTHEQVLVQGDAEHGATVHFVEEQLDGGPAILQGRLAVRADDTPETLAQRLIEDVEMKIYPLALAWVLEGRIRCCEGVAYEGDMPLRAPHGWTPEAA
jgi:phosphoribosylglycinamide formyltransferase-1